MRSRVESNLNVIWGLLVRIVLAAVVVWFVWKVRSVLITVILSIMLAYVLLPAVNFLCSKKIGCLGRRGQRLIATILVFAAFFFVTGIAVRVLVTPLKDEVVNFAQQIDIYYEKGQETLAQASDWYRENVPEDLRQFLGRQEFRNVGSGLAGIAGRIVESTTSWFKSIAEIVLIPVFAFYFVLDSRSLKREFIALMPSRRVREAVYLTREISGILQNYIIGQIILCIIAGVLTGIVLNLLGVPYALVLAVFAGITRAIPIIGPIVSGIPICIVGVSESLSLGIALLIFVVVMHFAESKFIMPVLIGDRMKLHPAVILAVLLIGAELFGVIGMFLAAPVAAIIRELVYFYIIRPRRTKPAPKEQIDDLPSPLVRSGSA